MLVLPARASLPSAFKKLQKYSQNLIKKLPTTFISGENSIESTTKVFIWFHYHVLSQFMTAARTCKYFSLKRTLQARKTNVVRANCCDRLEHNFLAANAQKSFFNFGHEFLLEKC
jgi:hypothetical protein